MATATSSAAATRWKSEPPCARHADRKFDEDPFTLLLRLADTSHRDPFDWDGWSPSVQATLMFIIDSDHRRVLLIEKLRGFGVGKVNGPGGKIQPSESPVEAAVRETIEETGIKPSQPEACGRLAFAFRDGLTISVDVFRARTWNGDLQHCEEAKPFWCSIDEVPYQRMWEDDRHWLPTVLDGGHIDARCVFDGERMLECHILFPDRYEDQ